MRETPLTEEEKLQQIARFFAQKRESFAQGILFNLCQGGSILNEESGIEAVKMSVAMADELITQLYPTPKEEKAE